MPKTPQNPQNPDLTTLTTTELIQKMDLGESVPIFTYSEYMDDDSLTAFFKEFYLEDTGTGKEPKDPKDPKYILLKAIFKDELDLD